MPLYEYMCNKCETRFETIRGYEDDKKELECPVCGSDDTQRILSTFGSLSSGASCSVPASGLKFG